MESVITTKGTGVPRERALVPLALVTSPFGPGGKLKLGEPDSPLAQAVQGGAEIGKTVAPKPDENREPSAIDKEKARVRSALAGYVKKQFIEGSPREISEAYIILLRALSPREIMNLIEELSEQQVNAELNADEVFRLTELGLKKLIGRCGKEDVPRLIELVKKLQSMKLKPEQKAKLTEIGAALIKEAEPLLRQILTSHPGQLEHVLTAVEQIHGIAGAKK